MDTCQSYHNSIYGNLFLLVSFTRYLQFKVKKTLRVLRINTTVICILCSHFFSSIFSVAIILSSWITYQTLSILLLSRQFKAVDHTINYSTVTWHHKLHGASCSGSHSAPDQRQGWKLTYDLSQWLRIYTVCHCLWKTWTAFSWYWGFLNVTVLKCQD